MPLKTENDRYQIILLVRRLFRALSLKSNENLEQFGVSVANRAVMEFLYPDNSLTVPEIAERYNVTRQHVQAKVNSLLENGLVVTKVNPRHKRSRLIVLSKKGRRLFERIMQKDLRTIEALFSKISVADTRKTRKILEVLLKELS